MEPTLGQAEWRKSSYSGGTGNCVEVAGNLPGITAVRDSQDPDGPALILTPAVWRVLTRKVRSGELDLAVPPAHPRKALAARRFAFPRKWANPGPAPGGFVGIGAKPPRGRTCTAASRLLAVLLGHVASHLAVGG